MTWFANVKTVTKLCIFLGVMVAMCALTSYEANSSAGSMKANQDATFQTDLQALGFVDGLLTARLRLASVSRDAVIELNEAKEKGYERDAEQLDAALRKQLDSAATVVEDARARALLGDAAQMYPQWWQSIKDAIAVAPTGDRAGDPARLAVALERSNVVGPQIDAKLAAATQRVRDVAAERVRASQAEYERHLWVSSLLLLLVVVVGSGFTYAIHRAVAVPLRICVRLLGRVADGDLTVRLRHHATDEVGQVADALNRSLDAIVATLTSVQSISSEVSTASAELAASAQQISAGAQEQAASLEETAASLEEISSTVKQNTDNAQEAAHLANSARDVAERGGEVVSSAVSAMSEITKSSKKIADIITTIDEIAFQTNLLALNAAVEAARAGEQGRGFGVVAAEVRTLAQRTGTAAKEIRGLIAESSSKVEAGTLQVNESGRTLEEIVKGVKRVTDMVAEIAAASREQSTGLDQVNTAVTQVDQVTQSNAAQTEEVSATATSLSDKSAHLQSLVGAFRLVGGASPKTSASKPRPAGRAAAPVASTARLRSVPRRPAAPAPTKKVANGGFEEF
ncbi:MAG: hypothetical protein JWP97_1709 [Labilithrix sp.]|nr:hypothetical protein [Labilithrix sp.]